MLLPHIKLFWKIKRGLEIVSLPHFPHNFWRKMFLLPIDWPNFIVWLPLLCEILDNMCITIVCKLDCAPWILRLTLSFQSSRFSYMAKKSLQKRKYLDNEKSFKDGIKSVFHNFKGLSVKQITQTFLKGESPTLKQCHHEQIQTLSRASLHTFTDFIEWDHRYWYCCLPDCCVLLSNSLEFVNHGKCLLTIFTTRNKLYIQCRSWERENKIWQGTIEKLHYVLENLKNLQNLTSIF